ncbi:hypothetical protein C8T65DRAFT_775235 [Cerioporus squamosus]|nr:hypothetical protein C8T65DRAFT_775235 [Cerioporus squamosus]
MSTSTRGPKPTSMSDPEVVQSDPELVQTAIAVLNACTQKSRKHLETNIPRHAKLPQSFGPGTPLLYWQKHFLDALAALCAYKPKLDVFTSAFAVLPHAEGSEERDERTKVGRKGKKPVAPDAPQPQAETHLLLSSNRSIQDVSNNDVDTEIRKLLNNLREIWQAAKGLKASDGSLELMDERKEYRKLWDAEQGFIKNAYMFCYPKLFHRLRKGGHFKTLLDALSEQLNQKRTVPVPLEDSGLSTLTEDIQNLYEQGSQAASAVGDARATVPRRRSRRATQALPEVPIGHEQRASLDLVKLHMTAHSLLTKLKDTDMMGFLDAFDKACALARSVNNLASAVAYLSSEGLLSDDHFSPTWVCRDAPVSEFRVIPDAAAFHVRYKTLEDPQKPEMTLKNWQEVMDYVRGYARSNKAFGWPLPRNPDRAGVYKHQSGVHCEIKIIVYTIQKGLRLDPSYVGGSKLCCVACYLFIQAYNKVHTSETKLEQSEDTPIYVLGCHQNCYAAWRAPSEDSTMAAKLAPVYSEMAQQLFLLIANTWKTRESQVSHERKWSDSTAGSDTRAVGPALSGEEVHTGSD